MKDRNCFICGEKHFARDCPNKAAKGPVKAIEDVLQPFFLVESAPRRPQPRAITLADFVPTKVQNKFEALAEPAAAPPALCAVPNLPSAATTAKALTTGSRKPTRIIDKFDRRMDAWANMEFMEQLAEGDAPEAALAARGCGCKPRGAATDVVPSVPEPEGNPSGGVCGAIGVRTDDGCRPKHHDTLPPQDLSSVFSDFGSNTLQEIIRKELEAAAEIIKKDELDDLERATAGSNENVQQVLNTLNYSGDRGTTLSTAELKKRVKAAWAVVQLLT